MSDLSATPGVVQLTISWSPPSEPNGIITMYQVSYNISGVLNYTNTSATQHTLRDLPPNTVVTFSVRAYTIIGPGEAVSDSTSTTAIRECRKTHTRKHACNQEFIHIINFDKEYNVIELLFSLFSFHQYRVSIISKQHSSEGHMDSPQPTSSRPLYCTYTLLYLCE